MCVCACACACAYDKRIYRHEWVDVSARQVGQQQVCHLQNKTSLVLCWVNHDVTRFILLSYLPLTYLLARHKHTHVVKAVHKERTYMPNKPN